MRRGHHRFGVIALALALLATTAGPALAHRLKLFLGVEGAEIGGYAFFVGGGRPEGVDVIVKDARGVEVHRGKTDGEGGFHWRPDRAGDYAVTVDAGDGHWVEGKIAAERFAGAAVAEPGPAVAPVAPAASVVTGAGGEGGALDGAALRQAIEASVDRAVARQLRPLIEAQVAAEGRVRFNDVMGGIGMIVGLAGAALWASARRRRPNGGDGR